MFCAHLGLIFFFLAQVTALQRAQEVVSTSSQDHVRIPRPAKIRHLRAEMRLGDDDDKYPAFRVGFHFFFFLTHTVIESLL